MHRTFYRLSGGRIGRRVNGFDVLLLTTRGRRSGEARDATLQMLPHQDGWAVIASNAGQDHHPAWFLNLEAHPEATAQVGPMRTRVVAREARADERAELWARFAAVEPGYDEYERRTTRTIPVVVLEPMR
jgi:deazaflavin-dependent oxidoreductase (nitroreductase family)